MIGVFAGTSDGKRIVKLLLEENHHVVVFNGSETGREMFEPHSHLISTGEKLSYEHLKTAIDFYGLKVVIDATHPYAQEITRNLLKVTSDINLPYLRYERASSVKIGYNSYEDIVEFLMDTTGNILLTTGSNYLEKFVKGLEISRLICRVLPTPEVINKCRDLGFKSKQIIGIQGPFSKDFNKLLMKEKNISYMVTKESGSQGGFFEKIQAAEDLGVKVLILKRPDIKSKNTFLSYDEIIEKVRQYK